MSKRDSMKWPLSALLLAGGVAVAEEWHPSGFQPAPVFEDEGLPGRRALPRNPPAEPAKPAAAAAAAPKAHPPAPPSQPAEAPKPAKPLSLPEEAIKSTTGAAHPARPEPPPVFEDEGLPGRRVPPRNPPAKPAVAPATAVAPAPAAPAPSPAKPVAPASPPTAQATPAATPSSGEAPGLLAGNYPIGLILLGLAGFVFWSARRPIAAPPSVAFKPDSSGKTGVARYLEGLESAARSGR